VKLFGLGDLRGEFVARAVQHGKLCEWFIRFRVIGLLLDGTQLLEQCEIVFEMSILDDLAILHTVEIERLEVDGLTASLDVLELPGEVTFEMQVQHRAVAYYRHVAHLGGQIGYCSTEILRCLQGTLKARRTSGRRVRSTKSPDSACLA
jgi:hypothetical protein